MGKKGRYRKVLFMDERYAQKDILEIWELPHKLSLWQDFEFAMIRTREDLGLIPKESYGKIKTCLDQHPIDLKVFHELDRVLAHDMNAAVQERRRWLPPDLQGYYHEVLTSYDVEDGPFAMMIAKSLVIADQCLDELEAELIKLALDHRYTIKMHYTHGQAAEIGTLGAEFLMFLQNIKSIRTRLDFLRKHLEYAKMSGATGCYTTITPEEEELALKSMGLIPFIGASQIMPRILWTPIAETMCDIVILLSKLATDIRLSARSDFPTMREGFGQKQMGSSVMPHKRNPIKLEQLVGMMRMACGFAGMTKQSPDTWEYRSIEMSSVERIAWPDLFHVAVYSLRSMIKILRKLEVYPDAMMEIVLRSAGTWAASSAKVFLSDLLRDSGLTAEEIYRIVQLASFNALEPQGLRKEVRVQKFRSVGEAESQMKRLAQEPCDWPRSIKDIIAQADLQPSTMLDMDLSWIEKVNRILRIRFGCPEVLASWEKVFSIEEAVKGEEYLYWQILGAKWLSG